MNQPDQHEGGTPVPLGDAIALYLRTLVWRVRDPLARQRLLERLDQAEQREVAAA